MPHPLITRGVEVGVAVPVVGTVGIEDTWGKAEVVAALSDYLTTRTPLPLTTVTVTQLQAQTYEAPILYQSSPVIGGMLSNFWESWIKIGEEPWVVKTLKEGYKIPFLDNPPLTLVSCCKILCRKATLDDSKRVALDQAVLDMIQKGAIEVAPLTIRFYSRIFLEPKPDG